MEPNSVNNKPLGQRLLESGLITNIQLDLALRENKRHGRRLGETLIDLGFVCPDALTDTLSYNHKSDVIDVVNTTIDSDVIALVDYDIAKEHILIPLELNDDILSVALSDVFNVVAIDLIERTTKKTVRVVTASEQAILKALERNYSQGQSIIDTIDLLLSNGASLQDNTLDDTSPMIHLVDQIIALGIKKNAADIHIEPDEKVIRIRYRVDGVLKSELLIPGEIKSALTARLKLMAEMNVSEKRIPQDGRIHFKYGSNEVDLRVSTLPTSHGESIVMRILDASSIKLSLDLLGFSSEDKETFIKIMNQPYGMVLVTGPTGSGKTTTLYTALAQVDSESRSIFTLEDPIEYALPMIRQTPIKPEVGMDFAAGLRALLRQDPDVMLVGEIRDLETAELAIRASLTGHLVLSTLHTNTAAGVIPRLIDMGTERYLLPSALNAVIGQRLVRKLCEHCKTPVNNIKKKYETYNLQEVIPDSHDYHDAVGCERCNQSGYQGRIAIYELMVIEENMHDSIINETSTADIEKLAIKNGMKPMIENGLLKAAQGLTTVEEIIRVIR